MRKELDFIDSTGTSRSKSIIERETGPSPLRVAAAITMASMLVLGACATVPTSTQTSSLISGAATLASIAAANNTTAATIVSKGATFCGKAVSPLGVLVEGGIVMAATAAGAPASVVNAGKTAVADTCAVLNLVPGALPAGVAPADVPAVPVPTTTLAPLSS